MNYMEEKNDLSGLNLSGFQNLNGKFNSEIFKDNETIELLRPVIRKYFRETKTIYRQSSSYGIKHVAENHIGTYVSNGELIYAMHLEGYKIKRDTINCCFNISGPDLRLLRNANEILEILSRRTNREIFEYLRFRKQFLKYKYHFKFLLYYKFSDNTRLKNDVIKIIAKEMNESVVNIKYWFDILKGQDSTIPIEKMEQLEKLFDMYATTLTNNIENITT
jgi:hypothetical protein